MIDPTQAQIGTVGGNPTGLLLQEQAKVMNGVTYNTEIRISWGREGNNYTAYKKIEIVVSAPSLPGKAAQQQADIQSIMAREGEVSVVPGGSLLARAVRNTALQKDVDVRIVPVVGGSTTTGYTDETGGVYFAEMTAGSYYIDVDPSGDWMMMPLSITGTSWNSRKTGTVVQYVNNAPPVDFNVDYPYNLSFQLQDANGVDVDKSTLYAVIVPQDASGNNIFTSGTQSMEMKVTDLENLDLWPAWTYELKLEKSSGSSYFYVRSSALTKYSADSSMYCWDGKFPVPSAPTTLATKLTVKTGLPTISLSDPVSGSYQINIVAKPANAIIYYTTDGSTPSVSSAKYNNSSPPTIKPTSGATVNIKALAVVIGLLMDSNVAVYTKVVVP
jgi:hypothetical protein